MQNPLAVLILGLVLGVKHAFEADHIIAVSTIVTEHRNASKAALIGAFWGIGHTTILFIIGIAVLILRISIPESISLNLEVIVGFMLILLGIRAIIMKSPAPHTHEHSHDEGISHKHLHVNHLHHHAKKPFVIGLIHGLAGSGALMLLILSSINSVIVGLFYILLFGIGSVLSMSVASVLIGLPIVYSTAKFSAVSVYMRKIAGAISIIYGLFMVYSLLKGGK